MLRVLKLSNHRYCIIDGISVNLYCHDDDHNKVTYFFLTKDNITEMFNAIQQQDIELGIEKT